MLLLHGDMVKHSQLSFFVSQANTLILCLIYVVTYLQDRTDFNCLYNVMIWTEKKNYENNSIDLFAIFYTFLTVYFFY